MWVFHAAGSRSRMPSIDTLRELRMRIRLAGLPWARSTAPAAVDDAAAADRDVLGAVDEDQSAESHPLAVVGVVLFLLWMWSASGEAAVGGGSRRGRPNL